MPCSSSSCGKPDDECGSAGQHDACGASLGNARRVARPALLRASSGAAADDNTWSWVPPAPTKDNGRKARAPSRFPATTAPLDRGDVLAILEDAGAVDVETIALPADAPGDAMVLASALSPKHLRSLADAVLAEAKPRGRSPRADGRGGLGGRLRSAPRGGGVQPRSGLANPPLSPPLTLTIALAPNPSPQP